MFVVEDLIIIGGGGAGCAAAIEASKLGLDPLILTKDSIYSSKTAAAQGGLQAAVHPKDSPELHYSDTLKAGNNKSNPKLARILANQAPSTIVWLESIGVEFDQIDPKRQDDGIKYLLKQAAGISRPRVLSCGDSAGERILKPLLAHVDKLQLRYREHASVIKLEKVTNFLDDNSQKNIFSVIIKGQNSAREQLYARSVIIATGGLLPKIKRVGYSNAVHNQSPDGVELARQVGASVKDVDLVQNHPTGVISPKELRRQRLPETMRGFGANLLDKDFKPFVDPLLTRGQLSDAIVEACLNGRGIDTDDGLRGVWLNTPQIDQLHGVGFTANHFPKFWNMFQQLGHDLSQSPVLVYPIAHYSLGGIEIDEHTQTTVPGLFAAGETTWGVHGEDRLMGNSLMDIFVFGRIAGKSATKFAQGA